MQKIKKTFIKIFLNTLAIKGENKNKISQETTT